MKIINYLKLTLTAVTLCLITVSVYAQEANENPLALLKEGNLRSDTPQPVRNGSRCGRRACSSWKFSFAFSTGVAFFVENSAYFFRFCAVSQLPCA